MMAASTRSKVIIRSDDMSADDFMQLSAKMVGNVYANLPRLDKRINIAGVYGRYEGVSFRHMIYRGNFTIELPPVNDEITFVMPIAGSTTHDPIVGRGVRSGIARDIAEIIRACQPWGVECLCAGSLCCANGQTKSGQGKQNTVKY